MVEVYAVRLLSENDFLEQKERFLSILPLHLHDAVNRHKRVQGAQRSLLGELISRKILSNKLSIPLHTIEFQKTDKGKPFLKIPDIHFNLSHSGDWVVFALAKKEVGIDVERIKKINYGIAERFFSSEEFASLNGKTGRKKQEYFFDLWTLKESYLKLIGTGLTRSLDSFTVIQEGKEFILIENTHKSKEAIFLKQYEIDDAYKLSVCSYMDRFVETVKIFTPDSLISL